MPQISKVRIVNFSYNDGSRFIPDELYDLTSPEDGEALNSLFNLNNGGGKTVLVQLLMQPVHPKAMAGGRHIEEYFSRPGDHSYVVIEWNTDGSREKLLTGISIAASTNNSNDENQRGNNIKYYTFKTVYEGESPYSIASLDLSFSDKGKYVPASFDYVREKAKSSRGLMEYYSSDDTVRWSSVLAEYGILRSEWETVIEVLNKDEGGLNQYFDDAKTSDRLISKFFIPAIEQKLKSAAASKADDSLETMLLNYAKKITVKESAIKERDTNRKLLSDLAGISEMSGELFNINDKLISSVKEAFGFRNAVSDKRTSIEEEKSKTSEEITKLEEHIVHIDHEEKSRFYYIAAENAEKTKSELERAKERFEKTESELNQKKHDEELLLCAKLNRQKNEAKNKITALKRQIEAKENDSDEAQRIAELKYSVLVLAEEKSSELDENIADKKSEYDEENEKLEKCRKYVKQTEKICDDAKDKYNSVNSQLDISKKNTDSRLVNLNIDIMRGFDGSYSEDEINAEKISKEKAKTDLENKINSFRKRSDEIEERMHAIPEEKANIKLISGKTETERDEAEKAAALYDDLYEKLFKVCEKHSLMNDAVFSDTLKNVIRKETEETRVMISKLTQEKHTLEDRLEASENGCVHIIPDIMKYVVSTGVNCSTGEEYLCSLTESGSLSDESAEAILDRYPELAYSLLFDNEKELNKLLSAGNTEWLPASVPLYTMDQMNQILSGNLETRAFLAACDRNYFADRECYRSRISGEIAETESRISLYENHLPELKHEEELAEKFDYPQEWREKQDKHISELIQKEKEYAYRFSELEKEYSDLADENKSIKDNIDKTLTELSAIERWFTLFAELRGMLDDEADLYGKLEEARDDLKSSEDKYNKACADLEEQNKNIAALERVFTALNTEYKRVQDILEKVENAKEAGIIEGDMDSLYNQYQTLLVSMHENIAGLKSRLDEEIKNKTEAEEQLKIFECEASEYESLIYSAELFSKAKREREECETKMRHCQDVFGQCSNEYSRADQKLKFALDALAEFENKPLPENEIGADFDGRKKSASDSVKILIIKSKELDKASRSMDNVYVRVSDMLDHYECSENIPEVILSDNPEKQFVTIKADTDKFEGIYNRKKNELGTSLRDIVHSYDGVVMHEITEKLTAVRAMLFDLSIKGDRLFTVSESISTMIESLEKENKRIETDLREIENDFNDIVNQCMIQGRRMYTDLCKIAASSRVQIIKEKPQIQMFKFDLPEEKAISEEQSKLSISTEIEYGSNELKDLIRDGAEDRVIRKKAKAVVGSEKLLHRYICQDTVAVKVYKVEQNSSRSVYKRWEDTLVQNSGGEKFVVFFSLVLTLMNYTRSVTGFTDKNASGVLILDNPFGKITSEHLLKPVFEIAKRYNVQLICFSDINKSDVINCFECVIKLVIKKQSLSDQEIMTHEGNDIIEHGYYKITNGQLSLF